jgi:hypothetical protein
MSSLIVICPHCLTWVELHADRCTECGVTVDIDAPDPDATLLAHRLGEPLLELGTVRLERRGWPSLGQLVATTQGLLFLPELVSRPNGAYEPRQDWQVELAVSWAERLSGRWWWPWHSGSVCLDSDSPNAASVRWKQPALERLFDSPGGLFVQRTSIRRLIPRWNCLRIERLPLRTVALAPIARETSVALLLNRLRELPTWRIG